MKNLKLLILFFIAMIPARADTLAWDANTETNLAGYYVYWAPVSNQTNQGSATVLIPAHQFPISGTNFLAGVTYRFYVTAFNTDGIESDPSDTVDWTAIAGVPPIPQYKTNTVATINKTWKIHNEWISIDPSYDVLMYYWKIIQGTNVVANGATTNTAIDIYIGVVNPTIFALYASNRWGTSQMFIKQYAQPNKPHLAPIQIAIPQFDMLPALAPPAPPLFNSPLRTLEQAEKPKEPRGPEWEKSNRTK